MLKILQARLQQYTNHELPGVQAGFRKGGGTRDQIANIRSIIEKAREFQKNIYFCFIDYGKAFDCVDHNKLWKILQAMGIPDHLTCLLRSLYAGHKATVRTGHWNNRLLPNKKRSTSRLSIVTLLILLIGQVHYAKYLAGWRTSWNQYFREKYQQPHICKWHHPCGRKWRWTKEQFDESERVEWEKLV